MFINAIAHYIPSKRVPNAYFESITERTDDWLVARTGIRERRRAVEGETTNSMALEAVKNLQAQLPIAEEEIDLIVAGTYTPNDTVVSPAHVVQHHLNVGQIPTLMVSAACSSFLNAVEVVEVDVATVEDTLRRFSACFFSGDEGHSSSSSFSSFGG